MPEPRDPRELLRRYGLTPKKHFGQNFLRDAAVARRIALVAAVPGATVVELGAGLGALTVPLLEAGAHVVAIERDRDLVPILRSELGQALADGRLELRESDAKQADMALLCAGRPRPWVLAGNLPYQLTGPLLRLAVAARASLDLVVFLVQWEVAQRLTAAPGSSEYGALSVFTRAAFRVERAFAVGRGAFHPAPRVDSAVVTLWPEPAPVAETPIFRALVRAAFAQRRKQLGNAWRGVLALTAEALAEAARSADIDLSLRGERLSVADFARMARAVERSAAGGRRERVEEGSA